MKFKRIKTKINNRIKTKIKNRIKKQNMFFPIEKKIY